MKCYAIYELTPAPWGDDYRYIKAFDRKEDAEKVLAALESVNIDFSLYKIIEYDRAARLKHLDFIKSELQALKSEISWENDAWRKIDYILEKL